MNESDQLQDDTRRLIERSATLAERSQQIWHDSTAQHAWICSLEWRSSAVLARAQRVQRLVAPERASE